MSPKEAEDGVVPVALVLEPARPQRYEVSVGYGTDTGPRASLGMRLRRLNRHAHHAQMKLEVSQIESSIAAQYNIPRPFPSTSVYSVFASFGDVSPTWSSTLIGTVGLRWTHERGPLRESFSMAWERSSYDVADRSGDATLVVAQAGWTWLRADDRLVTTRGHRLGLTVAGAHESVLSSASFLNAVVDGKIVRTLAPRLRALVRAQVGYILTDDLDELPPTRRFVTGGDQTIRGYEFETLGPTNVDGRLIGGDALAIGTIEFDYEVVPRWRAAVFTDAGNAWSDGAGVDVEYGVGAGVRWASPLGMIRLDGAFPVSDPDRSFRLHLVLGPDL
ncbi:MAG: BamA/TamA family outer membrane protein [Gemmatimonadota bacterium]